MNSQALDYFPLDTDFFDSDKIQLIEGEFGEKGGYLAVRLLCKIYGTKGYYYTWGEDECLLLSKKLGAGFVPTIVNDIVRGLVRRDFFNKTIFDSFSCLTSEELQRRYFEGVRKRKEVIVKKELILVDVTRYKNVTFFDEKGAVFDEKGGIFQQSKVKESKVNKTSSPSLSPPSSRSGEITPGSEEEQQRIVYFFTFEKNWAAPNKEYQRLLAYNNEPGKAGWENLSADSRTAYTKRWKPEGTPPPRFKMDNKERGDNTVLLRVWHQVYDEMVRLGAPLDVQLDALSDELEFEKARGLLLLNCTERLHDFIEQPVVLDAIKPIIWPYVVAHGCKGINYNF